MLISRKNLEEKKKKAIKDIAGGLASDGVTVFLNLETFEVTQAPSTSLWGVSMMPDASSFGQEMSFSTGSENNASVVKISPMSTDELWGMIHDFTEYLPAGNTKDTLQIILSDDKDFSKFNHFINSSSVANQWYEFRRKACERYVCRIIDDATGNQGLSD